MVSMLRGFVFAGVVVVLALAALGATGRLDNLRSDLGIPKIKNPFKEANAALTEALDSQRAWRAVVREADSTCGRYPQDELVIRPAPPRRPAEYAQALGAAIHRERALDAELAMLQPPSSYEGPYSLFLHNRQAAVTALERLRRAAREKNSQDYALAAGAFTQRKTYVDHYAATVGMSACGL